jgi:penicillin-binding protein 1A
MGFVSVKNPRIPGSGPLSASSAIRGSVACILRPTSAMPIVRALVVRLRPVLAGRPRLLTVIVGVLAMAVFLGAGWLAWLSYDLTTGLPDKNKIRGLGDMAQSTTIYDAADKPVFTIFKEQRIEIPIEKMSPNLIKAVISVEDQRFYEHSGIDAIRVMAAVLRNVQEGRRAEGGSTITQQLARQSFLTRDKTYRRKMKEVILATYIENVYSKNEILDFYLNKVYLGDGFYGVEAASRGYFAKSASDLGVDEAALLAGLIQSPSSYAPSVNLDRAIARRNVVLQTMVSSGAIDQAAADRARRAPVRLKNGLEIKETFGLYFKEAVRRDLVDRFGWARVYQGGLRVYTTLDPKLQQQAEAVVEKGLEDIEGRRGFTYEKRGTVEIPEGGTPDYLQGALVAMDPHTGYVRALVGGRDFNESRFNRAVQAKRQSGSAFKPFVFATALEAGYSPASVITGLNDPVLTAQGDWVPEDEHTSASSMTLRTALRTSSNRAAVRLLTSVGIPNAVSYAQKLNVGTPPSVPSLALGASDVSLLQLTAAYAAFADKGVVHDPVLIRRVEDSEGAALYEDGAKAQQAVSEATAFLMSSMLADVINSGTAYRARQSGFTLPAAGKTGTTNDYVDAWFVGFTPHLVTGVWVGFDQPKTIVPNGYAGELAVPMWASFMKAATRGDDPDWFDRPKDVVGVNVCRVSGKLPNDGCNSVQVATRDGYLETRSLIYTEYFRKGTQPTTVCPLHPAPSFFDRLAGVFGGNSQGTPVPAEQAGLPATAPTGTAGSPAPAPAATAGQPPVTGGVQPEEPKKKKRGFWSKVFGRGGDEQQKDKKAAEPKKRGG